MACKKRMAGNLPRDCWEIVVSKLMNNKEKLNDNKRYIESLSPLSKELLSITNNYMHSLTLIFNPSSSPVSRLFLRFPNITSLDLSAFRGGDLNALLFRIPPCSFFKLTSLNLSNNSIFPVLGLRSILSKSSSSSARFFKLTSLICSNIASLKSTDITFIADSFPFLQHLDISFSGGEGMLDDKDYNNAVNILTQKLSKLHKVNVSGNLYINDYSFLQLCINCEFLQDVIMFQCPLITHFGIATAILRRPTLNSLSVTKFNEATEILYVSDYFIESLARMKCLTCLDLSYSAIPSSLLCSLADEALPLTKLVLQGCWKCTYSYEISYTYAGISYLLSKCSSLQHLDLQDAKFLNDELFSQLCGFLPNLVSINVSGCHKLTNSAFFALLSNCPLLTEIRMKSTNIGSGPIPSVEDLVVYHQVKSLHLANNSHLQDKDIHIFVFMFPNMQLIDLSSCRYISEQGIAVLLQRCRNIRHLTFAFFPQTMLFSSINFEASNMEVLKLSNSRIDDEGLYKISKICPRLLQLDLEHCYDITDEGVRLAVENCAQLREINLGFCHKVSTNIVFLMISSRPSLRKITAPPHFSPRDRKLLFEQCIVF